jgi:cytochrome c oxidase subunit IV
MLTGVVVLAVGMHGYNGPGALGITIAIPVILVLILVAMYGRKKR